jgi:ribosome recycling factor
VLSTESCIKAKVSGVQEDEKTCAIRGVISSVMDEIKKSDSKAEMHPEKAKLDKLELEEILLQYLNESLSDDEKQGRPYNIEEARQYMQCIRQEIEKYAMKLTGNKKWIRFSPKVIQIAMCLWM